MIVTFLSKFSSVSTFLLAEQRTSNTIEHYSSAAEEPCISNGGSPFRYKDCPRITDAIFTEPYSHLYRYCGVTSQKSMSGIGNVRHRVDNLSTKNSSKEYLVALRSFFRFPELCLKTFRLGTPHLKIKLKPSLSQTYMLHATLGFTAEEVAYV